VPQDLTQQAGSSALQNETGRRIPRKPLAIGVARQVEDYFREHMQEGIEQFSDGSVPVADFAQGLFYCPGDIDNPESYQKLKDFLSRSWTGGNVGEPGVLLSVGYFAGNPAARGGGDAVRPLKTRLVKNPLVGTWAQPDAEPSGAESLQRASLPDRPLPG